jgi:hypothetical protein
MIRPKRYFLAGDLKQIPFYVRNQTFLQAYPQDPVPKCADLFTPTRTLTVSHRIPLDVCAILSPLYDAAGFGKITTTNTVSKSLFTRPVHNSRDVLVQNGDTILTFLQSDATTMRTLRPLCHVFTVDEYQGSSADVIHLVRLNNVPGTHIFDDENQIVVALSRHKKKLVYHTTVPQDKIYNMIEKGLSGSAVHCFLAQNAGYLSPNENMFMECTDKLGRQD